MTEILVAEITVVDDDGESTEEATNLLFDELRRLDGVVSLERGPGGVAPPGSRAGELVDLGTLVAVLTAHSELVGTALTTMGDWLRRYGRGRIEVGIGDEKIAVERATPEEQRMLVMAFVERVLPPDR